MVESLKHTSTSTSSHLKKESKAMIVVTKDKAEKFEGEKPAKASKAKKTEDEKTDK